MPSPRGKCVTQSDGNTRGQLVLRRPVWFWAGVPRRAPGRAAASESINRKDSWAGGSGSRSPAATLGPALWMSEVGKEAVRMVTTGNM